MTLGTLITGATAAIVGGLVVHLGVGMRRPWWALAMVITCVLTWHVSGRLLA
jgi:hypothetical protein